uniref:Uncharacterized protein n=1 Tax=Oscillatoriales cyanobacterium SpSt-402 TaxID=2282168 RepID=A0A832H645_9CYAN
MRQPTTTVTNAALRNQVHKLAEIAFHRHLISGHGDSEYSDKYQIVCYGKPRHLSLEETYLFLKTLITDANEHGN